MNDAAKDILTLIAKLIRERDTFHRMLRDTVKQGSELAAELKRYKQEIERHARAMRRARSVISSQSERKVFDEIYRKHMEKT